MKDDKKKIKQEDLDRFVDKVLAHTPDKTRKKNKPLKSSH